MGITISHKIGIADKKNVIKTLDRAERVVKAYGEELARRSISFNIERASDTSLYINIGNCETLSFNFKSVKQIMEDLEKDTAVHKWTYEWAVLTNEGKNKLEAGYKIEDYPQNEMYYAADFCKTQFCNDLFEHKAVADIIRSVASVSKYAEVDDEGEYYYTGSLFDAGEAIRENGVLINDIISTLRKIGYK